MTLISMTEAGKRMNVTSNSARRALQSANVPLVKITPRTFAVEEADLQAFIEKRGDYKFGRPVGTGKKVIEEVKQEEASEGDSETEQRAGS